MKKLFLLAIALFGVMSMSIAQSKTSQRLVSKQHKYYNYDAAIERAQDGEIEQLKAAIEAKKDKNKPTPHQRKKNRLTKKLNAA